jgi:hypothetical protein
MTSIAYTVRATFRDEATAREWIAWLEDGHVDAVIAGGAHSAMIVRLESDPAGSGGAGHAGPPRVEVRYVFSTREVFDRYVREHAPGLRADGMKRFPPERGVTFERTIGAIL